MSDEKYNGQWTLMPELCIYQNGEPPISGLYEIQTEDLFTQFKIEWTDKSGDKHDIQFGGTTNGEVCVSGTPGVSHVIYEKISNTTLDSTSFDGETILLYARRVASDDGGLLAVSQVSHVGGSRSSNFQVYRRKGT